MHGYYYTIDILFVYRAAQNFRKIKLQLFPFPQISSSVLFYLNFFHVASFSLFVLHFLLDSNLVSFIGAAGYFVCTIFADLREKGASFQD